MGAAVVPILLVLVVLVVGAAALVSLGRRRRREVEQVHRPEIGTLRYPVPEGRIPWPW